jgi:hypothetical protein
MQVHSRPIKVVFGLKSDIKLDYDYFLDDKVLLSITIFARNRLLHVARVSAVVSILSHVAANVCPSAGILLRHWLVVLFHPLGATLIQSTRGVAHRPHPERPQRQRYRSSRL